MFKGGAVALGGLGAAFAEDPNAKNIVAAKAIHQEEDFKAAPAKIYEAMLDAKQFAVLTGGAAQMNPEPGGTFSFFDGHITGRNIELTLNHRIVQAWRAGGWPEGVYSIARFELVPLGTGTRIVFDHTGFP